MEQAVCLETAALVAAPIFPNSVRWSEENLLAAAAGHLVTVLDPSSLTGSRGYISLPRGLERDIGQICSEDVAKPSLLPIRLRKETQTRIRSIDWSPQGFAPDGGCLLAVCSTAHDVKIFRRPVSELTSEWIEIADVSALQHKQCEARSFADAVSKADEYAKEDAVALPEATWQYRKGWQKKSKPQRKAVKPKRVAVSQKAKQVLTTGKGEELIDEGRVSMEEEGATEAGEAPEGPGFFREGGALQTNRNEGPAEGHGIDPSPLKYREGEGAEPNEFAGPERPGGARNKEGAKDQGGGADGDVADLAAGLPDSLFDEDFPHDMKWTEMLLEGDTDAAVAGEPVQAERETNANGLASDGMVEAVPGVPDSRGVKRPDLGQGNAKVRLATDSEREVRILEREGSEERERTEGQRALEPVEVSVEEAAESSRGSKRPRRTEEVSPRVTRRRSTRQRAESSHGWGQDGSGGRKSVGEDEEGGLAQKRIGRVRGGGITQKMRDGLEEGFGVGDASGAEGPGGIAPLGATVRGECEPASEQPGPWGLTEAVLEARGETGASAALEDIPLGGRQNRRRRKASQKAADVDLSSGHVAPSTWQLGSVSGAVLSTDEVSMGSRVEVLQTEEGLRGAWFAGTVVELRGRKEARVEYDELLENEETGEKLREWIPLRSVETIGLGGLVAKTEKPKSRRRVKVTKRRRGGKAKAAEKSATAETPAEFLGTSRTEVRPRLRPEVTRVDKAELAYVVGDHIEAPVDDAWWEGLVVRISAAGEASVYFPGDGDMRTFMAEQLRPAWEFRSVGSDWAPFGSETEAPDAAKTRPSRRVKGRVKLEPTEKSDEARGLEKKRMGRVRKDERKAKDQLLTTGGLKLPKVENEERYEIGSLEPEEKARVVREQERLGAALCERFRVLREANPTEALPQYEGREHLKGPDMKCLEQALAEMIAEEADQLPAAMLTVKELVRIGRQHIRRKIIGPGQLKVQDSVTEPVREEAGGNRKRKPVNCAHLNGGGNGEEPENGSKRKRRKVQRVDSDVSLRAEPSSEEDSDAEVLAKRWTAKVRRKPTDSALEKRRQRDRQKSERRREAAREAKRQSKAKAEQPPGPNQISAALFAARSDLLAALTVAWSPGVSSGGYTVLAVGSMSGHVALWKVGRPSEYDDLEATRVIFLGTVLAHDSWVSALGWAYREGPVGQGLDSESEGKSGSQGGSQGLLVLGTGSSDGSVRLWSVPLDGSWKGAANGAVPIAVQPAGQVCPPSGEVVSSLRLRIDADGLTVAVAKGAGELLLWKGPVSTGVTPQANEPEPTVLSARPSGQPLMGLDWAAGGKELFTCSQEGAVQRWRFDGENGLQPVTLELMPGERPAGRAVPTATMMRGYTGIAVSPNGLAIAGIRTLALGSLDTMYQAKAMRGALQVALCGRGEDGVKPEVGKRTRGKLSAAAEAAIQSLTEGRKKPKERRDWMEEFLATPEALEGEKPASEADERRRREGTEGTVPEADRVGDEGTGVGLSITERIKVAAERLRTEVLRSVERVLRSEGPLVLWDVVSALKELGPVAVREALAIVRAAAGKEQPGPEEVLERTRGTKSGQPNGLEDPWEDATGKEPGEGATASGADIQVKRTASQSEFGRANAILGTEDGLGTGLERESVATLPNGVEQSVASGFRAPEAGTGVESEGVERWALQMLYVLLLKLGGALGEDRGVENEASPFETPAETRLLGAVENGDASSARGEAPGTLSGVHHVSGSSERQSDRTREVGSWQLEVREVETVLRLYLAWASLAQLRKNQGPVAGAGATSSLLWADWAWARRAQARRRLHKLACDLYERCGVRSPDPGTASPSREVCPFCSSPVPLDDPDTAHCSNSGLPGTSARPSVKGHKLRRCMVTLLIQSSPAKWQCSCCSRVCIVDPGDSSRLPLCAFCGVLMHRPLPAPFLRPAPC